MARTSFVFYIFLIASNEFRSMYAKNFLIIRGSFRFVSFPLFAWISGIRRYFVYHTVLNLRFHSKYNYSWRPNILRECLEVSVFGLKSGIRVFICITPLVAAFE